MILIVGVSNQIWAHGGHLSLLRLCRCVQSLILLGSTASDSGAGFKRPRLVLVSFFIILGDDIAIIAAKNAECAFATFLFKSLYNFELTPSRDTLAVIFRVRAGFFRRRLLLCLLGRPVLARQVRGLQPKPVPI